MVLDMAKALIHMLMEGGSTSGSGRTAKGMAKARSLTITKNFFCRIQRRRFIEIPVSVRLYLCLAVSLVVSPNPLHHLNRYHHPQSLAEVVLRA